MNRWVRQLLGRTHGWLPLQRIGRQGAPTLVGIYGVPRGGTNFVAAQLHYHREIFGVSEHELDWRLPLALYWKKRSVMREHGWQAKQRREIRRVVFNKVQRGGARWSGDADFPPDSRFIFYFRNPIRCHLSRRAFLRRFSGHPFEREEENFDSMLRDVRGMVETYRKLAPRFPCLVLGHEYLCCRFRPGMNELFAFLDVDPGRWMEHTDFFVRCGLCRGPLAPVDSDDGRWLHCEDCGKRVFGHGHFNPLREIDLDDIVSREWEKAPHAEEQLARLRADIGDPIADYYANGEFDTNLHLA